MKKKDLLFYFIYTILLLTFIFCSNQYLISIKNGFSSLSFYLNTFLPPILNIFLGLFIGILKLYEEFQKKGRWSINIIRILFITLPCLYCIINLLTFDFDIKILNFLKFKPIFYSLIYHHFALDSISILIGYSIITSIHKINCNIK